MKWFQGGIAEAIAASKAKKAVFVVFVEGKDDVSQEVALSLNSSEVSSKLESEKFVAIRLANQLVPVPSIFFIGESGTPLEIIGNALSPSDLVAKIDSILLKANPQSTTSSANLIDAEQKAHSPSNSQETNKSQGSEPATSNPTQTAEDSSSNDATANKELTAEERAAAEITHEEKLRRARELIELQNKKRQEEEERKEREREIERRKMGRDVQKLRQQQQDREIREAQQERAREKAAEAAAREKILKQIAEDKLERKRKHEMHLQEKNTQQKKTDEEAQARAKAAAAATDMSKARIQFKLPTGSPITGTFDSSSTLGSLRAYVVQNAQLPFQRFSMSACFPRKDFTTADDSKTLLELDLVPSSVILILPVKSSNPASVIKSADGGGIFSHFIWTLLAPVVSIYNYVVGYFSGRPRGGDNNSGSENLNPGSSLGGNASAAFGRLGNIGARRLGGQGASKIRARGNVHTLHSGDNDNDENNTWNGNSTQQM
ncbi:hypothetical protein TSAR_011961 [Trichomalopsis sarcophagae]|uniref:UBX domain-containing protein 4 n=1 Tax=Trichomalopsis sarcophagae TaxID=543379 RepID=A0A232EZX6_9HYME|nr:hypothetical protein TSAR_011961 [Trichomalopsis sarcophagae]